MNLPNTAFRIKRKKSGANLNDTSERVRTRNEINQKSGQSDLTVYLDGEGQMSRMSNTSDTMRETPNMHVSTQGIQNEIENDFKTEDTVGDQSNESGNSNERFYLPQIKLGNIYNQRQQDIKSMEYIKRVTPELKVIHEKPSIISQRNQDKLSEKSQRYRYKLLNN